VRRALGSVVLAAILVVCSGSCRDATVGSQAGNDSDGDKVFRFSAIPDEKPTEQAARFEPVTRYLAEELGVPVEYVPVNTYSASVQAFKNEDVQAAWLGGLSGVQARRAVPGAMAIAQGDKDPEFFTYFIANKDSGLEAGDDFPLAAKGRKFTFGSEGSTSGRLMPEYFIRELGGEAPGDFFAGVGFSGNHAATIVAVNSGAFDIGALSYTVYEKAESEEKENTFILWKTPPYADYNLTIHGDLDDQFGAGFTARLKEAWLSLPSGLCERSFSRGMMIEATDADFAAIETIAITLGLAR